MKVWYVLIKDGKEKDADRVDLDPGADVVDLRKAVVKECKLDVAANELTVYADKNSWDAAKKLRSSAVVQGHTTEDTAYYVVANTPVHVPSAAAHVEVQASLGRRAPRSAVKAQQSKSMTAEKGKTMSWVSFTSEKIKRLNLQREIGDRFQLISLLKMDIPEIKDAENKEDSLSSAFTSEKLMQDVMNEELSKRRIKFVDCSMSASNVPCYSVVTELEDNRTVTFNAALPDALVDPPVIEIKKGSSHKAVLEQAIERVHRISALYDHWETYVAIARTPAKLRVVVLKREGGVDAAPTTKIVVCELESVYMFPLIDALSKQPKSHFLKPIGQSLDTTLAKLGIVTESCRTAYLAPGVFTVTLPVVGELKNTAAVRDDIETVLCWGDEDNKQEFVASILDNLQSVPFMLELNRPAPPDLVFKFSQGEQCTCEYGFVATMKPSHVLAAYDLKGGVYDKKEQVMALDVAKNFQITSLRESKSRDDAEQDYGVFIMKHADTWFDSGKHTVKTLENLFLRQVDDVNEWRREIQRAVTGARDSLIAMHKRGFVHMDVRRSNIACFNGVWHMIDFGLVRKVSDSSESDGKRTATISMRVSSVDAGAQRRHCGMRVRKMLEADKSGSTRVDVEWGFEDDLDMLEACIFDYLEPSNAKPQATSGGASRKRKHSEMSVR